MASLVWDRSRSRWDGIVRVVADAVASRWWPVAMLVAAALILWSGPDFVVRGVTVRALIAIGIVLGLVTWRVLDLAVTRNSQPATPVIVAAIAMLVAGAVAYGGVRVLGIRGSSALHLAVMMALLPGLAGYARWAFGAIRIGRQAVVFAALTSWLVYLDMTILTRPFRDARLYIEAGRAFVAGHPVYITSPMTTVPADWAGLPYLYPPFTLPFFGALSLLPHAIAVGSIVAACAVAVVFGVWLLGVPWRLVPLLLLWPPLTIGVQVGNVACFGFLLLAASWRFGAAAPLTGVFKAQSGVIALWLIRDRRWRSLAIGAAIGVVLILVTLPFTGVAIYVDWFHALGYFQASLVTFPSTMGLALQRYYPAVVAIGVAVVAIVVGLLVGGRQGLARLGVAAVVASPTVYIHGLAFGLPALLLLDATAFWALSAVTCWWLGGWWALGIALIVSVLGLSRRRLVEARRPEAEPARPDAHPLGALLEPWPEAGTSA